MSQCPNCGAAMSCGCQKKVLSNGKIGCTKCVNQTSTVEAKETETKKE
jgi:hypothetical protein